MATNASAGLIAAVKASLADATKGWTVRGVRETKALSSVSVSGGGGTIDSTTGGTVASVSSASTESIRTRVDLLSAITHGAEPMRMAYTEVRVGGTFSEALIEVDGGELRSTDTALNTTVMTMASAFLTAHDASLIDALAANDPLELPSDVAAGIVAALGDASSQWRCTSNMPMALSSGGIMRSISLFSAVKKIGGAPASLQYIEHTGIDGALIAAQIMSGGCTWRTRNAALRTAILAVGETFSANRADDISAAFT